MLEIHIRHGEASAETGWGLTDTGKGQVHCAAEYLRAHFPVPSLGFTSGSRRAVETAELLSLEGVAWGKDARLRESDWKGGPEPREFEPWWDAFGRVQGFCHEVDERYAKESRIVVSHGGTMRLVRAYREGFVEGRFPRLFEEPYKYFTNCQLIIYSDDAPNGDSEKGLWVKSVCPWNLGLYGHDWIKVPS